MTLLCGLENNNNNNNTPDNQIRQHAHDRYGGHWNEKQAVQRKLFSK